MPLLADASILDNSGPSHVAIIHNREQEYRDQPEVKARYARQHREWVARNRERLKAYRREYSMRSEVREKRLRYARGYRQRPEIIEKARRGKMFRAGRVTENWATVSLDAEITGTTYGNPSKQGVRTGYEIHGDASTDPLHRVLEESSEAQGLLAGITEDDIDHMDDHELTRLRERLIEVGATPSTQYAERARQRHLGAGK